MARLRRLLLQLLHAFRPDRAEGELAREVAAHLALLEDEYQRRGMTAGEARTAARRAIGGAEQVKIRHRDARSFRWLDELLVDVKYAVRRFRSRPGTNVLAVAMLSVAIGLSTAMFTIVDALIVRPLPFPHAERLTGLYMGGDTGGRTVVSPALLDAWRQSSIFENVEGASSTTVVVDTDAGPAARAGAIVTPGVFEMLGTRTLRGRPFERMTTSLDQVLISESLWRASFLGDEAIVGRQIRLDARVVTVIGVMPASFRFPEWNTSVWRAAEPGVTSLGPYVRLAAGVPENDILRSAADIAHVIDPSTAELRAIRRPVVGWAVDTYYQRAVPFLGGGVVLVALVLCANVSSLLLTRLNARRREFGVCSTLGAPRGRLLRQASVESLVLGACGIAAGLALAWVLVATASAILPQAFLRNTLNPLDLDVRALMAATVVGLGATLAAGIVPAWLGTRAAGDSGLRATERVGTASRGSRLTVRVLLVSEVALACALLVGATLLMRSFTNLSAIDRGFDPRGIVTLGFSFDDGVRRTPEQQRVLTVVIEESLRTLPAVRQVAWSSGVPMDAGMVTLGDWRSDAPGAQPVRLDVETFAVGPAFFDLYGIRLLKGRHFVADDGDDAVIVGERIASALWPEGDPVGRRFESQGQQMQVVGVVQETRRAVIDQDLDMADMYRPYGGRSRYPAVSLRCAGDCPSEGLLRQRALAAGRGEVRLVNRLDEVFARDLEQPRASAVLVGTFALVALLASAGGLFGVLSYAVQERRREFGIRSALGATPAAIAHVVYREGAIVGLAGLVLGAALATAMASSLASLSYGVTASDPVSVIVVITTLVATITFALWRPARNAAETDPALLLREE